MSGPSGGGAGAAARRPPPRMGGPFGGPGLPAEKPKNLKGSFLRLTGTLRPEAPRILLVIALAILSVTCAVVGPQILGNATDIIFDGVVSQQIPAGVTQQQAIDALNASGQTQQADMLAAMTVTPGQGIDFSALRDTLLFAVPEVEPTTSLLPIGVREFLVILAAVKVNFWLGFLAAIENGRTVGYNVLVGGGMGRTSGNKTTFPHLAQPLCFVEPDDVYQVAGFFIRHRSASIAASYRHDGTPSFFCIDWLVHILSISASKASASANRSAGFLASRPSISGW